MQIDQGGVHDHLGHCHGGQYHGAGVPNQTTAGRGQGQATAKNRGQDRANNAKGGSAGNEKRATTAATDDITVIELLQIVWYAHHINTYQYGDCQRILQQPHAGAGCMTDLGGACTYVNDFN